MSVQKAIDERTERLRAILNASNAAIAEKNGRGAQSLSGLPAAIEAISGEDVTWQEVTITPAAEEFRLTVPEGQGIRTVVVEGDADLVQENIVKGATIFGVSGSVVRGMLWPSRYNYYVTEAELALALRYADFSYKHMFIAESDNYITIGFAPESGISVTEYNAATTEFSSRGWIGYQYNKAQGTAELNDYRLQASPGGNFGRNIRYSDFYIEYDGLLLFPRGIDAYPATTAINYTLWDSGSFSETLETGDVLSYAVEFNSEGQPAKITAPGGSVTVISWEAGE